MIRLIWPTQGRTQFIIIDREPNHPLFDLRKQRDSPNVWRIPIPLFQESITCQDLYDFLVSQGIYGVDLFDETSVQLDAKSSKSIADNSCIFVHPAQEFNWFFD